MFFSALPETFNVYRVLAGAPGLFTITLTQDFVLDPVAKISEYKVCAVRLEKPRAER